MSMEPITRNADVNQNNKNVAVNYTQTAIKRENVKNTAVSPQNNEEITGIISKTSVEKIIEKANEVLTVKNIRSKFMLDDYLGRLVVQLIDEESNEVIRQIPTEDAIKISKNIDSMLGLILDNKS